MLNPLFKTTLPPEITPVLLKDSPFADTRGLVSFYFYLIDSDLNRFMFVPINSSGLRMFLSDVFSGTLTESKLDKVIEFLLGKLIFLLEFGRAFISGRKLYEDLSIGSIAL